MVQSTEYLGLSPPVAGSSPVHNSPPEATARFARGGFSVCGRNRRACLLSGRPACAPPRALRPRLTW